MKLRNKTNERLKRQANGCWTIVGPGDVIELDDNEAMYLIRYEPHYWEDGSIPAPAPQPEPIVATVAEAKPKPKKGGE
jgi:hypothetical protein